MLSLLRTTSDNPDFRRLVIDLDKDLHIRDGDEHAFFAQFNKIDKIQHVLVAYEGKEAVGCGALRAYDADTVEVKRMFVPLALRGQGIASRVLAGLEAWAKELGYASCILETGKKQPEAIALYHKNGYHITPNFGQYIGVENSVCFAKAIG